MADASITPGTRLTIQVSALNGEKVNLFSTYETAENHDSFLITAPTLGTDMYPLHKKERVLVMFVTRSAFFESDAEVDERVMSEGLGFLRLKCVGAIRRNQRRGDFRVDVLLYSSIYRTEESDPTKKLGGAPPISALVTNLSGGGAAVYTEEEIEEGKFVQLTMPDEVFGGPRTIIAQLHWSRKPDPGKPAPYKNFIGLRFIFASIAEKEQLVKYTFEQQRKQIKR
jgi:c-di-GMP-binding flagellar brake protein YcgR